MSRSNLTKYCACHAERLTYLVLIAFETSFTVRGATDVTSQPRQILRLSRRKTHILSSSHMKRHLQCAEQQMSRANLAKYCYCACHAERLTYLVLITYETSFTVRGATGVTIQPHQILRLSRRKTHILSPHHI